MNATTLYAGLVEDRTMSGPSYTDDTVVDAWRALAHSEQYGVFKDCEESLQSFLDSAMWRNALASGRVRSCCMLGGGGAPEKDRRILASVAHAASSYREHSYCLVDRSEEMLAFSREALASTVWSFVPNITMLRADFLDIEAVRAGFNPSGSVCYFLTGGTFGNADEIAFERAMKALLKTGDWLVIGTDTLDERDPDRQEQELRARYSAPEAETFFVACMGAPFSGEDAEMTITLQSESGAGLSAIAGGLSVCVGSPHGLVARSTRYRLADLNAWWGVRGWEIDGVYSSSRSVTYTQVVLRRL